MPIFYRQLLSLPWSYYIRFDALATPCSTYPYQVALVDSPINIPLCRYTPERKLKYFTGSLTVKSAYLILKWTKHYI